MQDITDGSSNTILIGSADAGRPVPWAEPEDIALRSKMPPLGDEGSFAAPYESSGGPAGLFLFADAHVQAILSTIRPDVLRKLLTIGGTEVVPSDQIPGLAGPKPSAQTILAIEIV